MKTEIQSRLSNESFNSVMRISMQGLSITEFKENNSVLAPQPTEKKEICG